MKKTPSLILLLTFAAGCVRVGSFIDEKVHGENPYLESPFYAQYLTESSSLDRQIAQKVEELRNSPSSPTLHNELGALLLSKGFPKDAEREFRRAIASDSEFYPAWYNLGLIRENRGDQSGAIRALRRTLSHKPGHAAAHFQLGLLYEKRGNTSLAIEHYARAYAINRALLDVRVNPRVVDTKLVERALIRIYPTDHSRRSAQFQSAPFGQYKPSSPQPSESISPQPSASEIVSPSSPVTDPGAQTPPTNATPIPPLNQAPPRQKAAPAEPVQTTPRPPSERFGAPARAVPPPPEKPPAIQEEPVDNEDFAQGEDEEEEVPPPPPPPPVS